MSHTVEEIKKHTRVYVAVFAALAALTVITVAISYLHLPTHKAVTIALIVAGVKGSLVMAYFMHLTSEKRIIFSILLLTAFFLIVILILPSLR